MRACEVQVEVGDGPQECAHLGGRVGREVVNDAVQVEARRRLVNQIG